MPKNEKEKKKTVYLSIAFFYAFSLLGLDKVIVDMAMPIFYYKLFKLG